MLYIMPGCCIKLSTIRGTIISSSHFVPPRVSVQSTDGCGMKQEPAAGETQLGKSVDRRPSAVSPRCWDIPPQPALIQYTVCRNKRRSHIHQQYYGAPSTTVASGLPHEGAKFLPPLGGIRMAPRRRQICHETN